MKNDKKANFLRDAAKLAPFQPKNSSSDRSEQVSEDDLLLQRAVQNVNAKMTLPVTEAETDGKKEPQANPNTDDKGLFGNRQIEFAQEVYYLPKELSGDKSQPVGLLTQSDLSNYVAFRKGDRLTFRYLKGDAGVCNYEAKRNGQETYKCDFDWSDGLIQELIDEGAAKLAE